MTIDGPRGSYRRFLCGKRHSSSRTLSISIGFVTLTARACRHMCLLSLEPHLCFTRTGSVQLHVFDADTRSATCRGQSHLAALVSSEPKLKCVSRDLFTCRNPLRPAFRTVYSGPFRENLKQRVFCCLTSNRRSVQRSSSKQNSKRLCNGSPPDRTFRRCAI